MTNTTRAAILFVKASRGLIRYDAVRRWAIETAASYEKDGFSVTVEAVLDGGKIRVLQSPTVPVASGDLLAHSAQQAVLRLDACASGPATAPQMASFTMDGQEVTITLESA